MITIYMITIYMIIYDYYNFLRPDIKMSINNFFKKTFFKNQLYFGFFKKWNSNPQPMLTVHML